VFQVFRTLPEVLSVGEGPVPTGRASRFIGR